MARLVVSWSGGKDSCLALARVVEAGHQVVGLLTTVSHPLGRVTMHGVRKELVAAQAQQLGLPLYPALLPLPQPDSPVDRCPLSEGPRAGLAPNTTYERVILAALQPLAAAGVEGVVFGDIFLEDLRHFRERLLANVGLAAVFPLWGENPAALLQEFHRRRGQAVMVCARRELSPLIGSLIGDDFRGKLPAGVDCCGENGEFHTFVFAFEFFSHDLSINLGAVVEHDGFVFQDLALS